VAKVQGKVVTEYLVEWVDQGPQLSGEAAPAPARPLPPEFNTWEQASWLPGSPAAIKLLNFQIEKDNATAAANEARRKQRAVDEADESAELRGGRGAGRGSTTRPRPLAVDPSTIGTHLTIWIIQVPFVLTCVL